MRRNLTMFSIPKAISILGFPRNYHFSLNFFVGSMSLVSFATTGTEPCLLQFPQTSGFLSSHIHLCVALAHHTAVVGFSALCTPNSEAFITLLTQPLGPSSILWATTSTALLVAKSWSSVTPSAWAWSALCSLTAAVSRRR